MKPLYKIKITDDSVPSVSQGNSKLGRDIWTFNLLPGDEEGLSTKDKFLTDVMGTCHGCCDGCKKACYAVNDTKRYHTSVVPAVVKNTLMIRKDAFGTLQKVRDILMKNRAKVCRLHSSGEFDSYAHMKAAFRLADENPWIQFYFYTKRFEWVSKIVHERNGRPPDNLVVNISEWHGNTENYDLRGLNRFVYDDHTDPEVMALKHCPAVDSKGHKTGVTCSQCGICWKKNDGHRIAVHAH